VIRLYSPLMTIGGGEVLSPHGKKARGRKSREEDLKRLMLLSRADSSLERMKVLIHSYGKLSLRELILMVQDKGENILNWANYLAQKEETVPLGSTDKIFLSREYAMALKEEIVTFLNEFHQEYPHQRGLSAEKIMENLDFTLDQRSFKSFLGYLQDKHVIRTTDGVVSLSDFTPKDETAIRESATAFLSFCRERNYQFPTFSELKEHLAMEDNAFTDLVSHLRTEGDISIIGGEYVITMELEKDILEKLPGIRDNITIGTVRDLTGSSRKFILPLLEYLDARGYTRRVGDKRVLRKRD
ncbi:MAG TPA: SelB C-terminal domain-containing protein, partial [Synergistales bacterium]|nr:SelB C-terminal domain-containing protein [Synergistales bacterium]